MTAELDDLYQQLIVDHSRRPRNFRVMENADTDAEGYNPLCGDRVHVFVRSTNGTLSDVSFTGSGCAICTASASLMTDAVKGKSTDDAKALFDKLHALLTESAPAPGGTEGLGKLAVFAGVKRFPVRVKCASLPWHTLKAALENQGESVSTE
jgi:nitrogen fixation NifU-like protein